MDFKTINPLWNLVDPLTTEQAAALIAGFDPNSVDASGDYFKNIETGLTDSDGIVWIQTAFVALVNAINGGKLKATLRYDAEPRYTMTGIDVLQERGYWRKEEVIEVIVTEDNNRNNENDDRPKESYVITPTPSWSRTIIERDDLRTWLASKGFHNGFFFEDSTHDHDYLDPKNPRYAPKLAAAIEAWQAVTDPGKKTPKQALERWLRENASKFGLVDEEGNPVNAAVEECSKVANWSPGGGAPKTPD